MGQYYKPIILSEDGTIFKHFFSHNYGNGLKLMEHSYLRNNFVNAVINTMIAEEAPLRLVWAGDYADEEEGKEVTLYELAETEGKEIKDANTDYDESIRFIINETKKEYVDLWQLKEFDGYTIHPLPLLTCEGNGRGGGDYGGFDMKYVGTWARDEIRFRRSEVWCDRLDYSYKEIKPIFVERYALKHTIQDSLAILSKGIASGDFDKAVLKEINDNLTKLEVPMGVKKTKLNVA